MNPCVFGEFGVKGCSHNFSLTNNNGVIAFGGQDFNCWADAFNFRRTDEDHFDGRVGEPALPNGAVKLASVGVAADANVERSQAFLFGILNFVGQKDRSGAGTEGGLEPDESLELLKSSFSQQLQKRARLAAGNDEPVELIELFRFFDEHNFGAQLFEPLTVRVKIPLQCQHPDFHGAC